MRKAPPVKAELPPRQASGEISSCNTEAPLSLADKAAQVAALPAPTTMMSCSGMSMVRLLTQPASHRYPSRRPGESRDPPIGFRVAEEWFPAFAGTPVFVRSAQIGGYLNHSAGNL